MSKIVSAMAQGGSMTAKDALGQLEATILKAARRFEDEQGLKIEYILLKHDDGAIFLPVDPPKPTGELLSVACSVRSRNS
jgi:hypothetical protein